MKRRWDQNVGRTLAAIAGFGAGALGLSAAERLTVGDIQQVVRQAAARAVEYAGNPIQTNAVIAVADREGYLCGVWSVNPAPDRGDAKFRAALRNAIGKAGTASFLSSSQHAFSTRTAGFIVQQNFPPGVANKPPGPLVGVNFSNFQFSDVNRFKDPAGYVAGLTNGLNGGPVPIPFTGGLAGANGGVPLYKNGELVGGLGVAGDEEVGAPLPERTRTLQLGTSRVPVADAITGGLYLYELAISPELVRASDVDEEVALAGQIGFAPASRILGSKVFAGGVALAYIESPIRPAARMPALGPELGAALSEFPLVAPPALAFPTLQIGGVQGEERQPIQSDPALLDAPTANDTIRGQLRLEAEEVRDILARGAARARTTRAGIRLPRGVPVQVFIAVVGNPDQDGAAPPVLGVICTSPDTTRFSWDVAVQKARTALFFSDDTRAFSSRTVGFLAQGLFPPGIRNTSPGIFHGLQERFSRLAYGVENPLNGALTPTPVGVGIPADPFDEPGLVKPGPAINGNLPNGITIFPGGFPLYRNGVLIGAVGVSGDGIDQDDLVGASAAEAFPSPPAIRADRLAYRAARLPYAKFPRNPAL